MANAHKTQAEPTLYDWGLFALIVVFGGSSFTMIRAAVETIPPQAIAAGRLWVAAILVYFIARAAGRRLPPPLIRARTGWRVRRSWLWMLAVGAVGNLLPFFIFPWAQQHVESGLAGVYMAFMPIWTVALAFLFASERLTPGKLAGVALGFGGVIILMGPDAVKGALTSDLAAQLGLLFATFLYAASAVISRRAPPIRPRVFAAGMLLCAAILATPPLFFTDLHMNEWSLKSVFGVIWLGVFPTGLNGVLIIMVIRRVGAGFMAMANYVVPPIAVALGALIYHERLETSVFIALALILAGIAVSQRAPFGKKRAPAIETGDGIAAELEPMVEREAQTRM
ncbi:MAG: EamA family transporter [Parvularculaceae bacterium]